MLRPYIALPVAVHPAKWRAWIWVILPCRLLLMSPIIVLVIPHKEATVSANNSHTPDRADKRARFAAKQKKTGGKSPAVLIAALAVGLVIVGGVIFALAQKPSTTNAAPAGAPAAQQSNPTTTKQTSASSQPAAASVKAATVGHAAYPVVQAEGGVVKLPLATFDDFKARHYTYVHDGQSLEFFIVKSKDGVVRAAFNACDVCYPFKKGYRQEGNEMVCNNCGRRFPSDQINVVQGGCNPSPLNRTVDGDALIIKVEDLAAGVKYF